MLRRDDVIAEAFRRTGRKMHTQRLRRLHRMLDWFLATEGVEGLTAECGTWVGTSAYVLCAYGAKLHCFDSFEGFPDGSVPKYRIDPELARGNLEGCDVVLHRGWIPEVFRQAPEGPYRFVHLDVDHYEPTRDAINFFRPRLAAGGMIVCDDYNVRWGAVQAVDEAGGFKVVENQAIYADQRSVPRTEPIAA